MRSWLPLRLLAVVLALVGWAPAALATPAGALPPPPREGVPVPTPPTVTAAAWILYDDTHDMELASLQPDSQRAMASTTKIMTALVALRHGNLDDRVVVSERAASVGEAEAGLHPGEVFSLRQLVSALTVRSANDAAMAVAEAVGGSVEGFVELMNQEAAAMGLQHTHFANPHGLDAPGHYSSPRDLLTLAREAMADPFFAQLASTKELSLPTAPDGAERRLVSTNRLLTDYPGAIGVKTGYTGQAGLVLVAAAERDGRRLYAVVMGANGSRAHFADAATLLDYGFSSFWLLSRLPAPAALPVLRVSPVGVEAALHLAAVGLWAPDADPVPEPEPPLVRVAAEPLPDLEDAASWAERYLDWAVGGG